MSFLAMIIYHLLPIYILNNVLPSYDNPPQTPNHIHIKDFVNINHFIVFFLVKANRIKVEINWLQYTVGAALCDHGCRY
jgi:hypothetical protein